MERAFTPHLTGSWKIAAIAVFLLGAATAVHGQDSSSRDVELRDLLSSLQPNTDLQLVTLGGAIEQGRLLSVGPAGIDVEMAGEAVPIGYEFVRSISVEEGHGVQGSVWGAAAGVVVGSFFGLMYASFDCRTASDCNYTEQQGALRWGIAMGAVGGGVGFMLGSRQVHWHPIFP